LIPKGERSGLLTRTAMTESVSLCVRMKKADYFFKLGLAVAPEQFALQEAAI
jgi:hypothetical protein